MLNIPVFSTFIKKHDYFSRFFVVGVLNTGLDLTLYFIFADALSIYPVVASLLSTGITMCLSFYLNHTFVFKSTKDKRSTAIRFVPATLFNVWGVQSLVIYIIVHGLASSHFGISHKWIFNVIAKLCGVGISFILNFIMYRYIFRDKKTKEPPVVL